MIQAFRTYLSISASLQNDAGTATTIGGTTKVCGAYLNIAPDQVAHITVCTFATPFKIGVHFGKKLF